MTLYDVAHPHKSASLPQVPDHKTLCAETNAQQPMPSALKSWRQIAQDALVPYGVSFQEAFEGRRRPLCEARWAVMAALRSQPHPTIPGQPRWSSTRIGQFLGRDHATVLMGVRSHERLQRERALRG